MSGLISTDPGGTVATSDTAHTTYVREECEKGVNGIRDSRPAPEAVLVGVGKTYSLGQGDHIHLVRALAPVAVEMTGIQKSVELHNAHLWCWVSSKAETFADWRPVRSSRVGFTDVKASRLICTLSKS